MKYLWIWLMCGIALKVILHLTWTLILLWNPPLHSFGKTTIRQHLSGVVLWPLLIVQFGLGWYNYRIIAKELERRNTSNEQS